MPTYQYSCTECGHFFEQVQSFSDDALTTCPACEGRLRKVFNAVGVVFKGSGFYRTDSRVEVKNGSAEGGKDGGTGAKDAGEKGAAGGAATTGTGSGTGSGTPAAAGSTPSGAAGSTSTKSATSGSAA